MDTFELFQPQFAARAGPYTFTQGVELEVYSSQSSYFDWAKIRFTEEFQSKLSIARKDAAAIELGYNGVFETVFKGYVSAPYNEGGGKNEITLKDDMLLLEETIINDTFLDTTPQEVIAYILAKAGVTDVKLAQTIYPARRQLPIRAQTVIEAINTVHAAWGIRRPFFFQNGIFYWGEKPKQDKVYTFERGVNILELSRLPGGTWELLTLSAPFIRHSHIINVIHPSASGQHEVKKVVSTVDDKGFTRTRIEF